MSGGRQGCYFCGGHVEHQIRINNPVVKGKFVPCCETHYIMAVLAFVANYTKNWKRAEGYGV